MTDTLRIAYLIDTISSDKAGTEKQLINLIKRLDYNSTVICLYESPWQSHNHFPCDVINLGYKGFLNPSFPQVLFKYLRCLKERDFDIVQTFFEDSMFVGCLGKAFSRRSHSLVVSRRDLGVGSDEPSYHMLYKKIRPFVNMFVDGIAVNAHAIKTWVTYYEKAPRDKIIVIGNGIDLPVPPTYLPKIFCEFHADVWIGIVANLKPVKRVDILIRSLGHLRTLGIREVVRVVILGEGGGKSELLQLAADLEIGDRVHFIGAVENVTDYLYGLDIGVLCSDKEGLSNAILEYMACGLPVVATNAGGNRELVDDTNGACIPIGDDVAMAQSLAILINSPVLRNEMGRRSLEKVKDNFTWDKILPQWESYYTSLFKSLAHGDNPSENSHAKA